MLCVCLHPDHAVFIAPTAVHNYGLTVVIVTVLPCLLLYLHACEQLQYYMHSVLRLRCNHGCRSELLSVTTRHQHFSAFDLQWFLHACMCVYVIFEFLGDPLSRAPTMRDLLNKVASKVLDKWERIGLSLDIELNHLKSFSMQEQ